jgi:hypothetical protein
VTNFNAGSNYAWIIAAAAGGIANFSADKFAVDVSAFQNDLAGGSFSVQTNGNSLQLQFTPLPPPVIGNITLVGTNLVVAGVGGSSGGGYWVLASTNLALPASQWQPVATNYFDDGGNFIFTNPFFGGQPPIFYRLQVH